MIDDDNEDFIIIKDILKNKEDCKYTIDWISNYEEGLQVLLEDRHDVYFIDYFLGAHSGIVMISKAIENGCDKPLIILTGQNDSIIENKTMKAGATDYLVKSEITSRSIETTIRYGIANANHKKEMKRVNEDLENKVMQRTQALEEILTELQLSRNELQAAVKKELKLNEMKSNFISTVSHEFRTPLTSILSSLYLVSQYCQKNDVENHAKHINRITGSVNYLTDLLNDMLSINILEEKKQSLHPELYNINSFMSELHQELKSFKKEKQKIVFNHSGQLEMYQDKKILKHIINNLVSNALKFSEAGKSIFISSEIDNSTLTITVRDNGIGIPEKDIENLFQRFYRGSNTANIQGTGLGLCIISDYLKMLDGTIDIKSKLSMGTTVTVSIPNLNLSLNAQHQTIRTGANS